MKILIITDAWLPQVNGVVRTYEHLSEELRKFGHDVKILGPSEFRFRIPMPGYNEIELALFPAGKIRKTIESYRPDKIHISTEGPMGWAARRYCIEHDIPFSTSYHTQYPDYIAKRVARILPFLYKATYNKAKNFVRRFHSASSAMMVATESLEETLRSWDFKNPMHRLIRGVNLDLFHPGERTQYKDLKGPIALYVGRVSIEKSIEDFLSMEWEGSKIVVGDGPARSELEEKYPDAHFVGKKLGEELAEYYRSADLFVFPSRTDTFGIVLLEALASGLPVAAYNVTGPRDIVTEKFLGSLHENDLAAAAHEAMQNGSPEERADFVKNYYTWENAARQYEDALVNKVVKAA